MPPTPVTFRPAKKGPVTPKAKLALAGRGVNYGATEYRFTELAQLNHTGPEGAIVSPSMMNFQHMINMGEVRLFHKGGKTPLPTHVPLAPVQAFGAGGRTAAERSKGTHMGAQPVAGGVVFRTPGVSTGVSHA